MQVVMEMARRLIWQNRSRQGGTKLLFRAKEIRTNRKLLAHLRTERGHSKAVVLGSNGEHYDVWIYVTGKVFCGCAFFQDLEPFQRQALGCKHLLAHALYLVDAEQKCA